MNIEATTTLQNQNAVGEQKSSSSVRSGVDGEKSFKEQLNTVKKTDSKAQADALNNGECEDGQNGINAALVQESSKNSNATLNANIAQNIKQEKSNNKEVLKTKSPDVKTNHDDAGLTDPIEALANKIANINVVKNVGLKSEKLSFKNSSIIGEEGHFASIKFDESDAKFFLNLVQNQQMEAQSVQAGMSDATNKFFSEIKSSEAQQAVQVSATLLSAMNEAVKTGKSFRIDFDKDVAVVMKVDRNGTISANFIPGDSAVENYLRNNIASLRQSFDNQGIAYNELTYSRQKQHQQDSQQRKNNKENEDE